MEVFETIAGMRNARKRLSEPVGFVPTMGYLHEGHLALVRKARSDNNAVVVSIFVNPTQFDPSEDFQTYPRDIQRDLSLLEREGVDIAFTPSVEEMYPERFDTYIHVGGVTRRLEGASRPGHFTGVATVVAKLFGIVKPNRAYFGRKDAQQLVVIGKMVADLNMDVEIVSVPTVREPDGLAMSSRNVYLNSREREAARVLWKALQGAKRLWAQGERRTARLRER